MYVACNGKRLNIVKVKSVPINVLHHNSILLSEYLSDGMNYFWIFHDGHEHLFMSKKRVDHIWYNLPQLYVLCNVDMYSDGESFNMISIDSW